VEEEEKVEKGYALLRRVASVAGKGGDGIEI
jgi:hypothetical protein